MAFEKIGKTLIVENRCTEIHKWVLKAVKAFKIDQNWSKVDEWGKNKFKKIEFK